MLYVSLNYVHFVKSATTLVGVMTLTCDVTAQRGMSTKYITIDFSNLLNATLNKYMHTH